MFGKIIFKKILIIILAIFAVIGMLFTFVFFGMEAGLFNVKGSIKERNKFFESAKKTNIQNITTTTIENSADFNCSDGSIELCEWNSTEEWNVIESGLIKDSEIIERVSLETGVPERVIVSVVVPEQIRFFTSNREVFKRFFEPLKILGSMSQFSLGVSGIKFDTAKTIEKRFYATSSPFYPGIEKDLLEYKYGVDRDEELFSRLTDADDHYYSYLYTAIYIKEIENQWAMAGFDISNRPEIIATIFNLGFYSSAPKRDPIAAGSIVNLGNRDYSYGELAGLFYNSSELADIFPI